MKKFLQIITFTFAIAASLFFIAGQSLDYFVFKYRQSVIRKEIKNDIKNGVSEKDLHTFTVSEMLTEKIAWIRPGKEFKWNGTMYDIVRSEIENGTMVYKCINDAQETELFAELDELIKKRMQNDSDDVLKNLANDFVKIYFTTENSFLFAVNDAPSFVFRFSFFHFSFDIPSPPPQVLG